jgi:hypothetical protein
MKVMDQLLSAVVPLVVALGLCAVAAAGEEDAPAAVERAAIDAAIDRGVAFLRTKQSGDGSWDRDLGKTGLGVHALTHGGVPSGDRQITRGLRWLLGNLGRADTYGASLAIMALAGIEGEGHGKAIARLARLIEFGQCRNGQWSYKLKRGRSGGDNSNTQFAILALWHADRAGCEVEKAVFQRCLDFFLTTQNEDGGWGYSDRERTKSYGSMSATGLAAIVICRSGLERRKLEDAESRRDPEVAKAIDWLAAHLKLDGNPEASFRFRGGMREVRKEVTDSYWRFYWLWSLERAAALGGFAELDGRDWYAEGAKVLLEEQRDDGSWVGSESPFLATSFAVLFLSRSTRRLVATEKPRLEGVATPEPR